MVYLEVDEDGEPLTAERLRDRGLQGERAGQILLRWAPERRAEAEKALRGALSDLVDAFLVNRKKHSDLFARAHVLGRDIAIKVGCPYSYDAEEQRYTLSCPIFALHRQVAHSVAWTLITKCSICGAGSFECDHIEGETYDGELCGMNIERVAGLGHIAWTANPDFLYTWHQPQQIDAKDLLGTGKINEPGEEIRCEHCIGCRGVIGPTSGDLDPQARFAAAVRENG